MLAVTVNAGQDAERGESQINRQGRLGLSTDARSPWPQEGITNSIPTLLSSDANSWPADEKSWGGDLHNTTRCAVRETFSCLLPFPSPPVNLVLFVVGPLSVAVNLL